jgi:hypothetical protein
MRCLKNALANTCSALLIGLVLMGAFSSMAEAGDESITITIDRAVMPQSLVHPGRFFTEAETVTVYDYVIRDYANTPVDSFLIQTASGTTKIPMDTVVEVRFENKIRRRTGDIDRIENVVEADMLMTDGTEMHVVMNADFGTIEGKTELGDFFLGEPHTVRHLTFNRVEEVEEPIVQGIPVIIEQPVVVVVPPKPVPPPDADGDGVIDSLDKCPDTPRGLRVDKHGCLRDTDGDGVPNIADICPKTPQGAPVNRVGCWTIQGTNFEYDSWRINPEHYARLDRSIAVLKADTALIIEIQGHTDEIASEQYNQILSEKRAEAARDYFISKGIDPSRISTRGFGETRPIASNETPQDRARNRRAEIKILNR